MRRAIDPTARRRKQLAAIHVIAQKQLRLDDATYRELLARVSAQHGEPRRSAADMDAHQRAEVLNELRRLTGDGARQMRTATPPPDGAPAQVREELAAMVAKVGALLAEAGRGWPYAHGMARRMFKVQRVEWLSAEQLHRLVSALVYDQKRHRKGGSTP